MKHKKRCAFLTAYKVAGDEKGSNDGRRSAGRQIGYRSLLEAEQTSRRNGDENRHVHVVPKKDG